MALHSLEISLQMRCVIVIYRLSYQSSFIDIKKKTSANRKPAPAARGLSVSCLGRPKAAQSAPSARRELRALDLSSIPARRELEANTQLASGVQRAQIALNTYLL